MRRCKPDCWYCGPGSRCPRPGCGRLLAGPYVYCSGECEEKHAAGEK